jgi:4-hydroxyacetophenone monooxygenase
MEGHKVHLFQRSPSWILPTPSYRQESSPLIQGLQKEDHLFSLLYRLFYLGKSLRGNLDSVIVDSKAKSEGLEISEKNNSWRLELEDYIQSRISGATLPLDWLIPNYPPGSRRLVLDDGEYLSAVLGERIEVHGASDIRNADDVRALLRLTDSVPENIVWATGFDPAAWTEKFSVVGETKETLKSLIYKSGLHYKGVMVSGYPNLFLAWGPNSNVVVSGSNTHMMELQAEFTGKVISEMAKEGHNRVSVGREVSEGYARKIASKSFGFAWGAHSVKSWYKTNEGLSIENWPGDTIDYFKELFLETLDGLDFS